MSNPNSAKQKYLASCNLTPLIWVNNLICINHQLNGWAKENYYTLTIRNLYPNLIIQCWWFCATQIFPLLNDLRSFLMPKNSCNGRWKMMTNLDPNLTTVWYDVDVGYHYLRINIFKFSYFLFTKVRLFFPPHTKVTSIFKLITFVMGWKLSPHLKFDIFVFFQSMNFWWTYHPTSKTHVTLSTSSSL